MISNTVLQSIDKIDKDCGTKAQGLKTLYENHINVPFFLSLSSKVLDDYCAHYNLDTILQFYSSSTYDESYLHKFDKIPTPKIDLNILEEGCYMVRSSSVPASDIDKKDFPSIISGAFDSFVASDTSEIPTCIKKVWSSAFKDKAYYQCKSFSEKPVITGLGVIIQKMINPKFSGVAHTLKDYAQVNWEEGHLSKIVSGETRGRVVDLYKSNDGHFIIRGKEAEIQRVIRDNKKDVFCDLLNLLLQIQSIMGTNLEVEWLYDGDKIWAVQAQELLDN